MNRLATLVPLLTLAVLVVPSGAQAPWSAGTLNASRLGAEPAVVGNLAIFAGGRSGGVVKADVDVFDSAAGSWSVGVPLSQARAQISAATVGNLTLFAGGGISFSTPVSTIDVYDSSLGLPSNPAAWYTATLPTPRLGMSATTVGTRVLFVGGSLGGQPPVVTNAVDVFDASIGLPNNPAAWSTYAAPITPRAGMAAAVIGNRAFFAGGADAVGMFADVDVYDDSSGTWTTIAPLSQARYFGPTKGIAVGQRAYFAGGLINGPMNVPTDRVDIYDSSTGTWSTAALSVPRAYVATAAVGNTLMFAGGNSGGIPQVMSGQIDLFNAGTGLWFTGTLPAGARSEIAAASLAGQAVFAGGVLTGGVATSLVEIFTPVGSNYCVAIANSSGQGATMGATGSASLAANNLVLTATSLPDNKPFLFLHSPAQSQVPFGNGYLCLGAGIGRIQPGGVAANGTAQTAVNLPAVGVVGPGVHYFQCWFRDGAAGGARTNTSDALAVTFVP